MRNRLNIALLDYVLSRAAVFAANAMSVSEYVERSVAKSKHLRGSAIVKRPLYNYVIARSDCICRAVAIPRKGSARLKSLVTMTVLQSISIVCAYSSALWGNTPQRRYPDRPPLMVKGTLFVVKSKRTSSSLNKAFYIKMSLRAADGKQSSKSGCFSNRARSGAPSTPSF